MKLALALVSAVSMIVAGGCKSQDAKPEPSAGSAPAAAPAAAAAAAPAAPTAAAKVAADPPAGSAAATGSAGSGACEDYYQSELKFFDEEHIKPSGKHDEFIAACLKLPAELQQCQSDLHYALDHDDACAKLLEKHQKEILALRALGLGK